MHRLIRNYQSDRKNSGSKASKQGIQPEYIEKVFEPLFSTKTHGIGFGLSITKIIVENHGGRVYAEAVPGGGAVFKILLPFAKDS